VCFKAVRSATVTCSVSVKGENAEPRIPCTLTHPTQFV
jgi:hypothetical protein